MTESLPLHYTASLLDRQPNAGIPGGATVFQSLANPPESGLAAEESTLAKAQAVGTVQPDAPALADRTRNRDRIRDFYDSASILRVSE